MRQHGLTKFLDFPLSGLFDMRPCIIMQQVGRERVNSIWTEIWSRIWCRIGSQRLYCKLSGRSGRVSFKVALQDRRLSSVLFNFKTLVARSETLKSPLALSFGNDIFVKCSYQ
ncbi:unnamed protein product [Heligmosomoides polygyrus]|uniref:ZP domain-containing protein n=1 Tax=Heligmosomoides polygyrus TaxID=6339 RepID=A0A183FQQ1_HELPZ|nr:unnamed protein product [Heligmosomoides polygyrus]